MRPLVCRAQIVIQLFKQLKIVQSLFPFAVTKIMIIAVETKIVAKIVVVYIINPLIAIFTGTVK